MTTSPHPAAPGAPSRRLSGAGYVAFALLTMAMSAVVFFVLALTVLLFSSFFFFFFVAELLDVWMSRWLAFLIVFLAMVVVTALLALLGYLRVRKLRAPEKTIDSLKQARTVLPSGDSQTTPALAGKHVGAPSSN